MKKKYKKILIISVIVILAALILFLLFKPKDEPASPPDNNIGNLPGDSADERELETEKFSLVRLSDKDLSVFDFWENKESGDVYYITTSGEIRAAKMGLDPEISTQTLSAINKIRPDEEGKNILVSFGDPNNPEWGLFDSVDEVWRPLPSYIKNIVWTGEENKVVSIVATEDGESLVFLDIEKLRSGESGVDEVLIKNFKLKDVDLSFISPRSLIITEKPAVFYKSRVWEFNTQEKKLVKLLDETRGLFINWSKNGIVFQYETNTNYFGILNKNLHNIFPVTFVTFPSKCCSDEEGFYCFVPENDISNLGPKINLPDDYFKNKFYTSDSFYNGIFESGASKKLIKMAEFKTNLDAYLPQQIEGATYFINKYDQGLYRLKINPKYYDDSGE